MVSVFIDVRCLLCEISPAVPLLSCLTEFLQTCLTPLNDAIHRLSVRLFKMLVVALHGAEYQHLNFELHCILDYW